MAVSQKNVKIMLTKATKKAYGKPPTPWQADAVAKAAEQYDQQVMLIDHPRGSGKTREIAMQTFISLRCNSVRLVLLITDRTDLNDALCKEVSGFLTTNGFSEDVICSCATAQGVEAAIDRLEAEENQQTVLSVTLQTFPHIKKRLSPALRKVSIVLADEVHRSHADRSLTEEMDRVLGGPVPLRMYTGTSTERCLRLFGNREERQGMHILRPFHSVTESEVAQAGMIFETSKFKFEYISIECDTQGIDVAAQSQALDGGLLESIHAQTQRTLPAVRIKAKRLLQKLSDLRAQITTFVPVMMVVCESRQSVIEFAEAFKSSSDLCVYGAFSGNLESDGQMVDEEKYNRSLFEEFPDAPHKMSDILVVCDRFETGYDNSKVCIMGIDRRVGSPEKFVQVFSRANRKRVGKPAPIIVDFRNEPRDVDRAILEFSVTRECLASEDQVADLSETLQESAASLLELKGAELAEALAAKSAAERQRLSEILPAYLKTRAKGVVRKGSTTELVPHSKALAIWGCLREHHSCDVVAAKKLARDIAAANCTVRGFSMLELDSQSAQGIHAMIDGNPTPQKTGRRTMSQEAEDDGDEITPEKTEEPKMPRILALEQFHASLPNNAQEIDAGEVQKTVAKEQLETDLKHLKSSKCGLRRPGYAALQRVIKSTEDASLQECLLESGAVGVLTQRLHIGEQVERNLAFMGIKHLAAVSPDAAKVVAAVMDVETLRKCTAIRPDTEIKALIALKNAMEEELAALKTREKLEAEILGKELEVKNLAKQLRASRAKKSTKQAEHRQLVENHLELLCGRCKDELSGMQNRLRTAVSKLQLLRSLDMCKVLMNAVHMCHARRAGVVEARKRFLELFRLLDRAEDPAAAGLSDFAADVDTIRKGKLSYSKPLSGDIARRFLSRKEELLLMAIKLGAVDDLITIATGPKANEVSVELLHVFSQLDDKAKMFIGRFEIAKAQVEADDQCDAFVFEVIPAEVVRRALSMLRTQKTGKKRTIKDVEDDK